MKLSAAKRFISVFLTVFMLFAVIAPAASAADNEFKPDEVEATCPTVFIHGFAHGDIYSNIGTDQQTVVWPMQQDVIMTAVESAMQPIFNYLLTHNWTAFESALIDIVNMLFEGAWNNPDGTAKENTGIVWSYPTNIDKTSTVSFRYDWRGDPLVIADELADFIDYVLEQTDSEKVAIECHSMGGIIFISYAAKYGLDKIHGAIMDTTAVNGASYMEKLFSNQFLMDGEAIYSYLSFAMAGNEYKDVLNFLFDTLFAAGTFDIIEAVGKELVKRSFERVAKECLIPVFGYWPSIWSMIPDAGAAECEAFVFDTVLTDLPEEHAVLRSKVQAYNEQVRPVRDEILAELEDSGRLMIISRYGFSMAPVSDTWNMLSDGVIDTAFSSFGATTAQYGKYLSDDYVAEKAELGYISPDKMVDASTCKFADVTWFVKDLPHSNDTNALNNLKKAVLFADSPVDIFTYEEYPQYLIYENGTINAYGEYQKHGFNILYAYGKFMQDLRDRIVAFFKSIVEKFSQIFI